MRGFPPECSVQTRRQEKRNKKMFEVSRLNRILEDVGRRDGIDGLRLGLDGTCGMELRNGVRIYFEYFERDERLCVYTPLRTIPSVDDERLFLLAAMADRNFVLAGNAAL